MKKVLFLILTVVCVSAFCESWEMTPSYNYSGRQTGWTITKNKPMPEYKTTLNIPERNPIDRLPYEVREWIDENPIKTLVIVGGGIILWNAIKSSLTTSSY